VCPIRGSGGFLTGTEIWFGVQLLLHRLMASSLPPGDDWSGADVMRLLRCGTHRKASPIGVLPIENRRR